MVITLIHPTRDYCLMHDAAYRLYTRLLENFGWCKARRSCIPLIKHVDSFEMNSLLSSRSAKTWYCHRDGVLYNGPEEFPCAERYTGLGTFV